MPRTVSALPPDAILVHIGPHKTGTTALQSMLEQARAAMAEQGVLYPGRRGAHHDEARALRQRPAGWASDPENTPDPAIWDELVREARAATGRVVISSEFFAQCDDHERAKLVQDLGADRVHLIVAARNPASIALSTWQQLLRQGHNHTLDAWLRRAFRRKKPTASPSPSSFWFWADAAALARRWAAEVAPGHLHVLVLDETDRLALPRTFEQLLGLSPTTLSSRATKSNRGLTAPEAELLHRVLDRVKADLSWEEYNKILKQGLLVRLVESRTPPADEPRSVMPPWAIEQAAAEADGIIDRLQELSEFVIGDVESLRRTPDVAADTSAAITEVSTELAAEAIAGSVEAAVRHLRKQEATIKRLQERVDRQRVQLERRGPTIDDLPTRRLVRAVAGRVKRKAMPPRTTRD